MGCDGDRGDDRCSCVWSNGDGVRMIHTAASVVLMKTNKTVEMINKQV